jgi:hypothetical protein
MNVQPFPNNEIRVSGISDTLDVVIAAGEIAKTVRNYRTSTGYDKPVKVIGDITKELKQVLQLLVDAEEITYE